MTELFTCSERDDLGGGRFRHAFGLKPIAYADAADAGRLKRIVSDWLASGISARPHIVTASQMMVSVGDDGLRRIHPTRELDRYMEIGTPYTKVAGVWRKVGFTGATRTANSITWHRPQADLKIIHAGHYIKLDIELLGGYVPEGGLVAFPVGLSGLTRSGAHILAGTETVALLRAPVVTDASNPDDVRPIAYEFTTLAGQPYLVMTLPSLTGMARPVVDPTLTLQPDATDGIDARISLDVPDWNYGVNAELIVGNPDFYGIVYFRTLVKFDLSTLPADATITAATFSLYCLAEWSANARTLRVYRLKRAWVEGTRNGANDSPATGVTFNRYNTTSNWSTAGGFHADDCEQTDIGSRAFSATEAASEFKDFALSPTTKANLDLGNGWMVKADTEIADGYQFASSDHATATYRPKMVANYVLLAGDTPFQAPFLGAFRSAF